MGEDRRSGQDPGESPTFYGKATTHRERRRIARARVNEWEGFWHRDICGRKVGGYTNMGGGKGRAERGGYHGPCNQPRMPRCNLVKESLVGLPR